MSAEVIHLKSVSSTNTWLKEHAADLAHGTVVETDDQTAGRGQRGNFWEAEPGKNLTISVLLRPAGIAPANQFAISETVALAVADAVAALLQQAGVKGSVAVKWPNDIYADNDKIAGILIENVLAPGKILHSVVGIGINVNQTIFRSTAPNPVSVAQLTGNANTSLPKLRDTIVSAIKERLAAISNSDRASLRQHQEFMARMWRNDGQAHRFRLPDTSCFAATIADVARDGMLALRLPDGQVHHFAFKEVQFL